MRRSPLCEVFSRAAPLGPNDAPSISRVATAAPSPEKAEFMSLPVNKPVESADRAVTGVNAAAVELVYSWATADVPWLDLPVIRILFRGLLTWLSSYISTAEQRGVSFFVIAREVKAEEAGISQALSDLLAAEKSGNHDAITQALARYATAHAALVHFDGITPRT